MPIKLKSQFPEDFLDENKLIFFINILIQHNLL
jgi:hypothetical protein